MKSTNRKFILGSEWIYYKIYSGMNVQQSILKNEVISIVLQLYKENIIDKFFYIRYADEDGYHLRLRFHLTDNKYLAYVLNLVCTKFTQLVETRLVYNVSLDTYNREIERYGIDNIDDVETLFSKNSLEILGMLTKPLYGVDENWLSILPIVDEILSNSGFDDYRKYIVMEEMYHYYLKQLGPNNINELKLKQRKYKKTIELTISTIRHNSEVNLTKDDKSYTLELSRIVSRYNYDLDNLKLLNVIKGLIHMAFNRFFPINQNKYELVVYYMLSHFYKSCSIKEKRNMV